MKVLRNAFYIGCIVILIAAFIRSRTMTPSSDTAIQEISTVDRGDIVLTVSATGPIRTKQDVPLTFAMTGKVSVINIKEGDYVREGQTLAILDTSLLDTSLKNAQLALYLQQAAFNALTAPARDVDIRAAQAALDSAKAQLRASGIGYDPLQVRIAELNVELAKNLAWQSQLRRDQTKSEPALRAQDAIGALYAQVANSNLSDEAKQQAYALLGRLSIAAPSPIQAEAGVHQTDYGILIAQEQLEDVQSKHGDAGSLASAQAAIIASQVALDHLIDGADEENIAIAKSQLEASQAALDLAKYNASRANLIAPFQGVVAKINLKVGEPAPLDQPALILLDDSDYFVDIPVDEVDVPKLAVGQETVLTLDSLPGMLVKGKVSRIAETSITVGDVVTYPVRIDIERQNQPLRAGMSATATITVDQINNTLRVRNRFVRLDRKANKATVIIRQPDGSLKEVEVKLGLRNETYSQVISGLEDGQMVVALPRDVRLNIVP